MMCFPLEFFFLFKASILDNPFKQVYMNGLDSTHSFLFLVFILFNILKENYFCIKQSK